MDFFHPRDCWILGFYFRTRPWNSNLIRLRDAADRWVQDVRLSKKETCVLCLIYFVPHDCCILDIFFEPAHEIWTWYLIRLMEAADGWVRDVRLSEKETCVLSGFILFHVIALGFHFQSHPWNLNLNFVWTRVDADRWVLDVSIYIYQRCCSIKLIVPAYKILVLPCITQLPSI
jgi:hypothetical protein